VRWRESGAGSRQRSRTFTRKADAEQFHAQVVRTAQLGAHAPAEPSRQALTDWLRVWFADGKGRWAKSTAVHRGSIIDKWIKPYLGDTRLSALGRRRVMEWRREITDAGCTPKQVNAAMRVLSSALAAAVVEELLPANPCAGIKRLPTVKTDHRALSADEAERIRLHLPTLRDRVLWGLLYAAGLRTEEALPLRWRDLLELTRTGGTIAVDRVFVHGEIRQGTKTGAGRDVEIIPPLADDLLALRAEAGSPAPDDLLCPSKAGTPMSLDNWRSRVFNDSAAKAGAGWATPYTGRRTYISLRIHAGDSPLIVAAAVGHTNAETIWRHYAREFERARQTRPVPLADAVTAARRRVLRGDGVRPVCAESNVVQLAAFRRG
jgi:integrase